MWSMNWLVPALFMALSLIFLTLLLETKFVCMANVFLFEFGVDSVFIIDFLSQLFFFVVSLVSFSVFLYSNSYMSDSLLKKKFMVTMTLFMLSMLLLVSSADLFWVMVGWDGLGLTSLCLIFFFQNWKSLNSSMITFLSNRLGDSFIIVSLLWMFSFSSKFLNGGEFLFILFFLVGGFSKSAQIPFSAWLPLAMAAPTPVSSLVHSSTLVTAGIFLFLRFKSYIPENGMMAIFIISSSTIFLAGFSSMSEFDIKKIIALSTLSHVSLMMMFISMSSEMSVMIHFHSHAMFKSLLFMISGNLIHLANNEQDLRKLDIKLLDTMSGLSMVFSLASMMGLPFLSGFYSKELLLLVSSGTSGLVFLFIFFIAVLMTASYSLRILFLLISKKSSNLISGNSSDSLNWGVFILMSFLSVMSGGLIMKISSLYFLEIPSFNQFFVLKKQVFLILFLGILIGIYMSLIQGVSMGKFVKSNQKMWWLISFSLFFQKWLFNSSSKSAFEFDSKGILDWVVFEKKTMMNLFSLSLSGLTEYFPSSLILFLLSFMTLIFLIL